MSDIVATGSRHSVGFVEEVTYGVIPTNPEFKDLRHNGFSVGLSKGTFESEELRPDRQISALRHGVRSVSGNVPFDLSCDSFDDLIEAAFCGTWVSDVLKAGVTRRSFALERYFGDLHVPEWHRLTGAEVDMFELSIKPEGIVAGTFGFIGRDQVVSTVILPGATYLNAATTEPLDGFTGTITEGGAVIAIVNSLDFKLENGLSPINVIGSNLTNRPVIKKSRVTGSITAYFTSLDLLEKFIDETNSTLEFTLSDGVKSQTYTLPNIKYTGGQPDVGGEGEVTLTMPFTALYDATEDSQITLTRVV